MPSSVPAPIRLSANGSALSRMTAAATTNKASTVVRRTRSGRAPMAAAVPISSGSSTSRIDPDTSPPARDEIRRLPAIFAATTLFGLRSSTPQNGASVWLADFGRTAAGTGVRRSQPRVPVDRLGQLEDLVGQIQ